MNKISIIIPSYKRANGLLGKDYFTDAKYCVPESQALEYIEVVGKKRVIAIPDKCDGSITKKRNWILKNIPRPLVMIDDDVRRITHTEGGAYFIKHGKADSHILLPKNKVMDLFAQITNLANDWECKLWGINCNGDGINYQQQKPFSLTSVVLGPLQGHLVHDLMFDDAMGTKDDYDMALQHLRKYKKVLRCNKYAYDCAHGDNKGGIVSGRSMDKEMGYCKAIMKKWGANVIRYKLPPEKMTDLLNAQNVNVPIAGV